MLGLLALLWLRRKSGHGGGPGLPLHPVSSHYWTLALDAHPPLSILGRVTSPGWLVLLRLAFTPVGMDDIGPVGRHYSLCLLSLFSLFFLLVSSH